MKILWITNIILPEIASALGMPVGNMEGWLASMLHELTKNKGFQFTIATIYDGKEIIRHSINNITYILLPAGRVSIKYKKAIEPLWKSIVQENSFDIIHIQGTEYTHALSLMNAHPNENYIISIQGMVSVIARYYYSGISIAELLQNITFRDLIRNDMMLTGAKKWKQRGRMEKEYLCKTKYVIGRTTWDMVHSKKINPQLNYYFCNENLRSSFYKSRWNLANIEKHSIFLSQASYPIKGLHMMLRALFVIKKTYPDCTLNIAGRNITKTDTLKSKLTLSGYGKYIQNIIIKYKLSKHIIFTGNLNQKEMAVMYATSHVFACPSSIENSPNSLGEAQLIGTPVVASYVGGVPDMVEHKKTGLLYCFKEYEILADSIMKIFADDNLASLLSKNGRIIAKKRHDAKINAETLSCIYNDMTNKNGRYKI